jgi:hypothetical protein
MKTGEISLHHIRVDVKAWNKHFSYEYDVPESEWPKYEELHGKKDVSCFAIPDGLYWRLHDDEDDPSFRRSIGYELDEFHAKIVRANVSTELRFIN